MNIELCDLRGKVIDHDWQNPKGYIVGRSGIRRYHLCDTCGKPLERLVQKLETSTNHAASKISKRSQRSLLSVPPLKT
ncbi:MAG: hypothetical protein RIQ56_779 [Candidatus Parcubacteria bacterium]|jgi:hypothetical protein